MTSLPYFWLRGERPPEPIRFDADTGLWHVYGYPETQLLLAETETRVIATELLDADPHRIDLVADFAHPLPVTVIAGHAASRRRAPRHDLLT